MKIDLSSLHAEQYVLAAMTNPAHIDAVMGSTSEALFSHDQHLAIYRAMKSLYSRGKPVDIVTLLEEVGNKDYFGFVSDLYTLNSGINTEHYLDILRGYELKRRLYSVGQELIHRVHDEDAEVVREAACNRLTHEDSAKRGPMTFRDIFLEHGPEIERRFENQGKLLGLPTGFEKIDYRLNGMKPQDLIIIAARPSMGKTTYCLNIAEHNALRGETALFFSMEMSASALMEKMLSSVGGIPLKAIQTGAALHDPDMCDSFKGAAIRLKESGIVIDDRPALTISEMRAAALSVKRKAGKLGLIVVDYLGLARGEGATREQEVSSISRGLKMIAKDLNCPVIALSQLSRGVENRTDKRPIMSDLRDSGGIEQDADLIGFLYRDDYYNENSNMKGVTEVIWRKFRNGEIGTDYLGWQGDKSRFVNLSRGWEAPQQQAEVKPIRRGMSI